MKILADVLQKLVIANDQENHEIVVTKFHALRPPSISIHNYLARILRFANCTGECFVLALVYIDRLIKHQNYVICGLNIHRIIITSVTLAAKFFDDAFYKNTYYARIGGIPVRELNSLELEFLFLINFTLHVTPADFFRYQTELCDHARRTGQFIESSLPRCDIPVKELEISETDEDMYSDAEHPRSTSTEIESGMGRTGDGRSEEKYKITSDVEHPHLTQSDTDKARESMSEAY